MAEFGPYVPASGKLSLMMGGGGGGARPIGLGRCRWNSMNGIRPKFARTYYNDGVYCLSRLNIGCVE